MWTAKSVLLAALIVSPAGLALGPFHHAWPAGEGRDVASRQVVSARAFLHRKRGKVIDLKSEDSGRSLDLGLQQTIRISLGENPTTGYRWQILEDGAPVLRLSKDSFQRGSSSAVGAGGTRVLEFLASTAGTASLRLGYLRPSDPASQKSEFVLRLVVSAP
jgi:inhibitor of cysteine peptidase